MPVPVPVYSPSHPKYPALRKHFVVFPTTGHTITAIWPHPSAYKQHMPVSNNLPIYLHIFASTLTSIYASISTSRITFTSLSANVSRIGQTIRGLLHSRTHPSPPSGPHRSASKQHTPVSDNLTIYRAYLCQHINQYVSTNASILTQ